MHGVEEGSDDRARIEPIVTNKHVSQSNGTCEIIRKPSDQHNGTKEILEQDLSARLSSKNSNLHITSYLP